MRKRYAILAVALVLAGCDFMSGSGSEMVRGSGTMKTEERPVTPFTAIRLATGDAVIERSQTESLSVTAEDNLMELFTSEVRDGTLVLSVANGKSFQGRLPSYRIGVKDLRKLDVAGSGSVNAKGLSGDTLALSVSGSGSIDVAGEVDELGASISGSGSVGAANLKSKRAKISVSGSGRITVNASEALDARVSGSGSISYLGAPKLKSNISGSGSIRPRSN